MKQFFAGLFTQMLPNASIINNTPPTFAGISGVTPNPNGSFTLSWLAATGATVTPIRYEVYAGIGALTGAQLFTSDKLCLITEATTIDVIQMKDLGYFRRGVEYTFGVRAVSAVGIKENNINVISEIAIGDGNLAQAFQDMVASLQQTDLDLKEDHTNFQNDHQAFIEDNSAFQDDHVHFQEDHSNFVQDHLDFQNRLIDFSALLTTLNGINSALSASASSISGSALSIAGSAATIDSAVTSINASAIAIANTQELLADNVATFSGQLATLAGSLSTFAGYLTELGADVTAINSIIDQLNDIVIALTNIIIPDSISGDVQTSTYVGCNTRTIVYKGEDKTLDFQLRNAKTGGYFDLTAASEIAIIFQKQDGYQFIRKLTDGQVVVDDAALSKFHTALQKTDTALLMQGEVEPVEIRITISGIMTIVQIPEALNVIDSLLME